MAVASSATARPSAGKRLEGLRGWLLGLAVIVIVLVISAALWFHFHP
jgi:hypothetical protein